MSELKDLVAEAVSRVFTGNVSDEIRTGTGESPWPAALWRLCVEQGFDQFLVPESTGGGGGLWIDAAPLVRGCGEHAVPLPLPEALAARWLLALGGLAQPAGIVTLAPQTLTLDGALHVEGLLHGVPWGRSSDAVVVVCAGGRGTDLAVLRSSALDWHASTNLAGEPRDDTKVSLNVERAAAIVVPPELPEFLGALLRAGQMAGASLALLERSTAYAHERTQFGRKLGQFQVIQHNLARLATAASAMNAAASAAFVGAGLLAVPGARGSGARLAVAIAKCRASELAESVAAIAHQVHGAMGFTAEVGLHAWTRRLWSWRGEFGNAAHWAGWLGAHALRRGPERLWADLTDAIPGTSGEA